MKISHRFNLYVAAIFFVGIMVLFLINERGHATLLREVGINEARRLASAIFGELYTSMKLGGGRVRNRAIMKRYRKIEGVEDARIIHSSSVNRQYGVEEDEAPLDELERLGLEGRSIHRVVRSGAGHKSARFVMPLFLTDRCTGCHASPPGSVSGIVSISISLKKYQAIIWGHKIKEFLWWSGVLVFTLLAGLFEVRRRLLFPLTELKEGLSAVSRGDLTHRVELNTGDELQEVGEAFNSMAGSLFSVSATLGEINKKYAMLLDMAADAIVVVDVDTMKYVEANKAATTLTGYTREELFEKGAGDLVPGDVRAEYIRSFKRWVFDGRGFMHDAVISRKDGSTVPVEVAASLLEFSGKRLIQEIWRDISERKGFEERLKRQIEELEMRVRERTEDLNRSLNELDLAYGKLKDSQKQIIRSAKLVSLGEMGAGIAHELNSPLAGILSITEVLMNRLDRGDRNYYLLEKIKDAAVRSKYIILDMLSYARPARGDYSPVFLNSAIRSTLSLFVSEIKTSAIEIKLDLDPELPTVLGARGQLMEVIFNIVKNAGDVLGGKGTIFISSTVRSEGGREEVVVEIKDTGPGVPVDTMDRIFDPFFTSKDKGGGKNVGLGLSISQSIIEEHGGRMEVENMEGGGACFRIILPVTPSPAPGPEKDRGDAL